MSLRTLIGAIDWSAFTSDRTKFIADFLGSPSGITATRIFTDFGHRAPKLWSNYSQWGSGIDHQAIKDAELLNESGVLDFIAYNWYPSPSVFVGGNASKKPPQSDIMIPAEAHFASANKTLVKAMYMVFPAWFSHDAMPLSLPGSFGLATEYRADLVARMQDSAYFRFNGRPVLGIYGYQSYPAIQAAWLAQVDSLIADLGEPIYILEMSGNTSAANAHVSRGCRWKTNYGPNPGPSGVVNGNQYPFTPNAWDYGVQGFSSPGGGLQLSPSIAPFLDQRPRNTGCWWIDQPTQPEWQNLLSAALRYTQSGFTGNGGAPEILMIYSRSEIDEGGPGLVPTVQEGSRYYDAIRWLRTGRYPETYRYTVSASNLTTTKTGTWTRSAQTAGMHDGDEHMSTTTTDYVEFKHERCRHLGLRATTGPDRGIVDLSIDGGAAVPVDLYSPMEQYQVPVYMSPRLLGATHTIRATVTGTKNPASVGVKVAVDCWDLVFNP